MPRERWVREELIKALELYWELYHVAHFASFSGNNPDIIRLAQELGRTVDAVTKKLRNFAEIDPSNIYSRDGNQPSSMEEQLWGEFSAADVDEVLDESRDAHLTSGVIYVTGDEDVERLVRVRGNAQRRFREAILKNYRGECCVTGLKVEKLLVASHIKPWAIDKINRLNPCNGLCLNVMHDKVFDLGLITIDPDNRVVLSGELKHHGLKGADYIARTEGKAIQMPEKFSPRQEFLEYHRNRIFVS